MTQIVTFVCASYGPCNLTYLTPNSHHIGLIQPLSGCLVCEDGGIFFLSLKSLLAQLLATL